MLKPKRILLASHGTDGARAAEKLALGLARPGTELHHLVVVPDFWKGMMGDDWLNNAATREIYGRYVESELAKEIRRNIRRLQKESVRKRIRYRAEIVQGKPTDCLVASAARDGADLVVIGSPRPKGKAGLRSRMQVDELARTLKAPLLIVPYPR